MKKMIKLLGVTALLAIIGFTMLGCGKDDDPTSVRYTSYDAQGNRYDLVVDKDPNRAYIPQEGDLYILTVTNSAGTVIAKSEGTITSTDGNKFTLEDYNGDEITITISGNAIGKIEGTIPGVGGKEDITSPTLTPNNGGGGNGLPGGLNTNNPDNSLLSAYGLSESEISTLRDAPGGGFAGWIIDPEESILQLYWTGRNETQCDALISAIRTLPNKTDDYGPISEVLTEPEGTGTARMANGGYQSGAYRYSVIFAVTNLNIPEWSLDFPQGTLVVNFWENEDNPISAIYQGGPFEGKFTTPNVNASDFYIHADRVTATGLGITNVSTGNGGTAVYKTGSLGDLDCSWVFIYEGSKKIGIAIHFTDHNVVSYTFGKSTMSEVDGLLSGWVGTLPDVSDMTDDYVGSIND